MAHEFFQKHVVEADLSRAHLFGKPDTKMTEDELRQAFRWLMREYTKAMEPKSQSYYRAMVKAGE